MMKYSLLVTVTKLTLIQSKSGIYILIYIDIN